MDPRLQPRPRLPPQPRVPPRPRRLPPRASVKNEGPHPRAFFLASAIGATHLLLTSALQMRILPARSSNMPRPKRAEQFPPNEVAVAHCIQRCVRRAYLAGIDAGSQKSFEHRREWIRRRMELLASIFGMDVLSYAVLSNHIHVMLRTRPDVVKTGVMKTSLRVGCDSFQVKSWKNISAVLPSRYRQGPWRCQAACPASHKA